MIWKITFLFLFFSTSFSIIGQNLIPNNSFEEKKRCPKKLNQIKFLKNWYSPTKATPDFFYKCNTSKSIKSTSIPKNVMGNQDTFQGNGYVGIISIPIPIDSVLQEPISSNSYREYLQCKLPNPLQANDVFLIELYVSLADRSLYSSNKLQVNFSKNKIRQKSDLILEDARNYIDCNSNEYFGDKTWHKVQGRYVAKGGERFITIGLFEPNFNYKERTQKNGLPYIYHYIDNISLVKLNDIDKYR